MQAASSVENNTYVQNNSAHVSAWVADQADMNVTLRAGLREDEIDLESGLEEDYTVEMVRKV